MQHNFKLTKDRKFECWSWEILGQTPNGREKVAKKTLNFGNLLSKIKSKPISWKDLPSTTMEFSLSDLEIIANILFKLIFAISHHETWFLFFYCNLISNADAEEMNCFNKQRLKTLEFLIPRKWYKNVITNWTIETTWFIIYIMNFVILW